jgi:hypothetical protein
MGHERRLAEQISLLLVQQIGFSHTSFEDHALKVGLSQLTKQLRVSQLHQRFTQAPYQVAHRLDDACQTPPLALLEALQLYQAHEYGT